MAFDAQGNHSLPSGTIVNTGDKVLPSQHNPAMQDISASLSSVLVRDGRAGMVGNLPMGGFKAVNMGDGTDTTDGATVGQIGTTFGSQVGAATSKAVPVDADYVPLYDSAASNALRKLTWVNLKATLKAYFDTIYPATSATLLKAGGVMTGDLTLKGDPTTNLMAVTKQYADGINVGYESPRQTITAGGSLTLAHGLGEAPKRVHLSAICVTAERNYSVGDELMLNPAVSDPGSNGHGFAVTVDATNLNIRFSSGAPITGFDKSSGVWGQMTSSSWKLIVRAWT